MTHLFALGKGFSSVKYLLKETRHSFRVRYGLLLLINFYKEVATAQKSGCHNSNSYDFPFK